MNRRLTGGILVVVAFANGCGAIFGSSSAGDSPAPAREVPAAARTDSGTRRTTTPPPTTAPAAASPSTAPPAAAPSSPVAVARPAELASAVASRRAALIADSLRLGADEVGYYMDVQEAKLRQLIAAGYAVARRDSGLVVTIPGPLTFEVGSARLLPSGLAAVSTLGKVLAEYDRTIITLNGYTDSSGDTQSNLTLSQARTISLSRQLIADGVASKRIVAVGHGDADPLVDNATPEGRERNRRIEVRIDPVHR